MKKNKLSEREIMFCTAMARGGQQVSAARLAGYKSRCSGYNLMRRDDIVREINRLKTSLRLVVERTVKIEVRVEREDLLKRLKEILIAGKDKDAISACAEIAKLEGYYAPEKHASFNLHQSANNDADIKRIHDQLEAAKVSLIQGGEEI
jgi:phage terminase small subunit